MKVTYNIFQNSEQNTYEGDTLSQVLFLKTASLGDNSVQLLLHLLFVCFFKYKPVMFLFPKRLYKNSSKIIFKHAG